MNLNKFYKKCGFKMKGLQMCHIIFKLIVFSNKINSSFELIPSTKCCSSLSKINVSISKFSLFFISSTISVK